MKRLTVTVFIGLIFLALMSFGGTALGQASVDSMLYEIVQTNPDIGATPPDPAMGFCSTNGGALGCLNLQRYVRTGGAPGNSLVGSWLSAGDDVAPLLAGPPFNIDSLYADFYDNSTYRVRQVDANGASIELIGVWQATPSGFGNIWNIVVNQSSPIVLTSEGIFEITSHPLGIDDENPALANAFQLKQNYPNPFNPGTQIEFTIPSRAPVKLTIYNTLGEEVAVLVNDVLPAGNHQASFRANNLGSGTYFYHIQAGKYSATKKMLLLR